MHANIARDGWGAAKWDRCLVVAVCVIDMDTFCMNWGAAAGAPGVGRARLVGRLSRRWDHPTSDTTRGALERANG
jgi:hypothetical protein